MSDHIDLEICVESVEAALEAEAGGADRIELCADLAVGGVTPSTAVMMRARNCLKLPLHVIVRPRAGDFVYSAGEFGEMKEQIKLAQQCGMNGIVVGILNAARRVDVQRTSELVQMAHPLPVTFHRAFDESCDLLEALEDVIQTGAVRLLTSGGRASAIEGESVLAEIVERSAGRIRIMPGAGINASNALSLIRGTGVREIHASLGLANRAVSSADFNAGASLRQRVRELKTLLGDRARF